MAVKMFGNTKEPTEEGGNDETDKENVLKIPQSSDNKQQKSFLSWINRFNNTNNNNNNQNCKASTLNEKDISCDEYRGVQGLKEFWNSRISLIKSKQIKSATLGSQRKSNSFDLSLSASRSVSCLLNDRHIDRSFSFDGNGENVITEGHQQFDNFYKYKNSTTSKRFSFSSGTYDSDAAAATVSSSGAKTKIQKVCGIGTNFPLIASTPSGDKIHWAKREDIFVNRKSKPQLLDAERNVEIDLFPRRLVIVNDKKCLKISADNRISSLCGENLEMAIKSSHTTTTGTSAAKGVSTDKTDSGKSQNGSTNSLSSDSPLRKKNSTSRKYSFKTHAKTYYGSSSKKMSNHNSGGGNKVAMLTHQFNQLVQKDASILEEVKKKNGILLTRAGHVYKVKEEIDGGRKKPLKKDSGGSGDDISLKSGKRKVVKKISNNSGKSQKGVINGITVNGTVKAAVKKIENKSCIGYGNESNNHSNNSCKKPKVPLKSEQVLQRTREIAIRNSHKNKVKSGRENGVVVPEIHPQTLEQIAEETKNCLKESSQSTEKIENETLASNSISDYKESVSHSSPTEELNMNGEEKVSEKLEKEDTPSKKIRYSSLYEKYLYRSTLPKKAEIPEFSSNQNDEYQSEQKITDALDAVNKRLGDLSKIEEDRIYEELKAKMKPNNSFLFRENSRNGLSVDGDCKNDLIVEAVNSRLINKTQSLDELTFPTSLQLRQISLEERNYPNILQKVDELLDKLKPPKSEEEEDLYEPITVQNDINTSQIKTTESTEITKVEQISFVYKERACIKNDDNMPQTILCEEHCIYQSVAEIKGENLTKRNSICSYESVENYESVPDDDDGKKENHVNECDKTVMEDEYDLCNPPEPPPPRKSEGDVRNTSDQLPPLPVPKRIFASNKNCEKINCALLDVELDSISRHGDEHSYDDENIYDTIKGSHCYESLGSKNGPKCLDVVSIVSNCYESIGSLRRNTPLRHSDSISTLSSDQKTNSLYGMSLGQQRSSIHDGSSDDNSDEWIDISDAEEEREKKENKQQFIVVRERTKCHRSPDWSKRVRDQRTQQHAANYIDDDSDHFYEPLYTRGEMHDNTTISDLISGEVTKTIPDELPPSSSSSSVPNNNNQQSSSAVGETYYSDDYDSFNTEEESDEEVKKNDSGVDISNTKLPDPPPSTNQVYAFVKKVKNFISNKKSSSTSRGTEATKVYENTQFYVGTSPEYQNTPTVRDKKNKSGRFGGMKPSKSSTKVVSASTSESLYENTEFHTPRVPIVTTTQSPENCSSPFSTSVIPKMDNIEDLEPSPAADIVTRKKSKSGKSFKSKLRKSLGGPDSGFNIGNTLTGTRSTFYISDSVDVDSGIFEKNPSSDTNLSPAPSNEQCDIQKGTSTVVPRKTKKNLASPELNRRKTTIGIRPNIPPPPPPVDKKSQKKRTPTTSWYAECGVFKSSTQNEDLLKDGRGERSSSTSWYAEAGLYQTSGASVASSSGSSGVSTGGEGGPGDDNSHSMFSNEPLYQIYSAAKLESISRDMEEQDSTDGYEEIGTVKKPEEQRKSSRPSALQLVGPKQGPSRTLWSEIPEVVNSEILNTLTTTEKRLQEAKFEILTSEASYLKSLNLLKTHFMNHPAFRDTSILSSSDRKTLFAHIVPVHECSDRLLCDLETCWQDNIMLLGLSKSLYKHAEKYFHVYISFCEQQGKMDRTLRRLKENKNSFSQTLDMLEADPACCGLNLHSFLMLPMQRITRLPLLIDAVFSKVKSDDDEYEDWKITLAILNKIVSQCNEAANRCEQTYEIEKISRQIEFPSNIRSLAIAPAGIPAPGKKLRTLVKKGELIHLIWRGDDVKLTFGKKFTKCNIFMFLFTDLLVLTKKKSEDQYVVFDYCPRLMITVSSGDAIPQLPIKELTQAGKNLLLLTLLENHEGKTVEMILSCPSVSEQQRWLQATSPPESDDPNEKLYEQWDCPQVVAKHPYVASEPDLLSLEPGDVVNVTRKMTDGWYQGERIRDGATGWFPGNFTEEVNSPHVRARNLKQRYRLLTFTASYLESMKRNK